MDGYPLDRGNLKTLPLHINYFFIRFVIQILIFVKHITAPRKKQKSSFVKCTYHKTESLQADLKPISYKLEGSIKRKVLIILITTVNILHTSFSRALQRLKLNCLTIKSGGRMNWKNSFRNIISLDVFIIGWNFVKQLIQRLCTAAKRKSQTFFFFFFAKAWLWISIVYWDANKT